jgi:hypothetical protein
MGAYKTKVVEFFKHKMGFLPIFSNVGRDFPRAQLWMLSNCDETFIENILARAPYARKN